MQHWKEEGLHSSERDHPFDKRYLGQCFSCGKGYAGPKRSVLCNLCLNRTKTVDKDSTDV